MSAERLGVSVDETMRQLATHVASAFGVGSRELQQVREARTDIATSVAELRDIASDMRARRVNGNNESPTLIAWAKRIEAAALKIGGAP